MKARSTRPGGAGAETIRALRSAVGESGGQTALDDLYRQMDIE